MNLPPPPDRWTIDIANAERINAISSFGFTERQAQFLVNVLLHAGVFVERQYCAFAGIVHGQKSTDFIKTLVERRLATAIVTGKLHRGRMFHVHYKPLWAAVGEPDNRFRKPAAPGRMIERVMLLTPQLTGVDGAPMIYCAHAESISHRAAGSGGTRVRGRRRDVRTNRDALRGRRRHLGAMAATPAPRGHARPAGEGRGLAIARQRRLTAARHCRAARPHHGRTHAGVQPAGSPCGARPSVEYFARPPAVRIRVQKTRSRPAELDRARVQAERAAFQAWAATIDPRRLVFLDESGANLAMGRSHAWLPRGTELIEPRPMNWGEN